MGYSCPTPGINCVKFLCFSIVIEWLGINPEGEILSHLRILGLASPRSHTCWGLSTPWHSEKYRGPNGRNDAGL